MRKWGQVLRFASSIPNQINSAKQKARLDPIYFILDLTLFIQRQDLTLFIPIY